MTTHEDEAIKQRTEVVLLNIDHIISIKPINIVLEERIVRGYWIRLTNGKKYRTIDLPLALNDLLSNELACEIETDEENLDLFH